MPALLCISLFLCIIYRGITGGSGQSREKLFLRPLKQLAELAAFNITRASDDEWLRDHRVNWQMLSSLDGLFRGHIPLDCLQCMKNTDDPRKCSDLRNNYIECLHHRKEFTRVNAIYRERQRQLKEGIDRLAEDPVPQDKVPKK